MEQIHCLDRTVWFSLCVSYSCSFCCVFLSVLNLFLPAGESSPSETVRLSDCRFILMCRRVQVRLKRRERLRQRLCFYRESCRHSSDHRVEICPAEGGSYESKPAYPFTADPLGVKEVTSATVTATAKAECTATKLNVFKYLKQKQSRKKRSPQLHRVCNLHRITALESTCLWFFEATLHTLTDTVVTTYVVCKLCPVYF